MRPPYVVRGYGANPVVCGRRFCAGCGHWRHVCDFPSRVVKGRRKFESRCRTCAARYLREWHAAHPGAASGYAEVARERLLADPERLAQRRERDAARERASRIANPEKHRAVKRAEYRRRRRDPEKWAATLARQRADAARRAARRALRARFMEILLEHLRAELVRREREARAERERRRAYQLAWRQERRARWLAGEVDDVEPVFKVNGDHGGETELARLPAGPLAVWVASQPVSVDRVAVNAGIHPRSLRRYTSGESVTVAIEVVDVLTTRLDVGLHEIYDPGQWPSLYEVPDPIV